MEAIRRRVWNGKILVKVTVSHPESIGTQDYLLVVGRISYIYSHLPTILSFFGRYLEDLGSECWWFEFRKTPIPPNRPLGLVYDSLVGLPTGEPWQLTLRRGSYPTTEIICFDATNSLQTYWINQLKESCYLRIKNAKPVMLLSREEHEESWAAIHNAGTSEADYYWHFWKHHAWLVRPLAKGNAPIPVPIRMYISRTSDNTQARDVAAAVPRPVNSSQTLEECFPAEYQRGFLAIVQGVEVPKTAPLGDLYSGCIYADGFLHVTLLQV